MKTQLTFYVAAIFCLLFSPFLLAQNQNTYGNEWIDYSETYYKFKIEKAGIYKIPYSTLQNAGLADLDGNGFHLFAKGREVPIFVSSENAMTENDYIEFYAEANDGHFDTQLFAETEWQLHTFKSLFSDSLTYYLTWNDANEGLRFVETENNLTDLPPKEPYFMHSILKIFDDFHFPGQPFRLGGANNNLPEFENGEGFVGHSILGGTSQTHTLQTPFKYTGTDAPLAHFESKIVGRSDDFSVIDDHHVQVKINGLVYQDISSGYRAYDNILMETPVFLSSISAETEVEYISVGDQSSTDINAVAYIEIIYPRQFNFYEENKFFFTLENNEQKYLEIALFEGGSQPVVYDLTNKLRLLPVFEDNVYKISLPAGEDISLKRELFIFNTDIFCELNCEFPCIPDCFTCDASACAASEVQSLEETQFTDFAAAENQGNYIILTHPSLRNGDTDHVQAYSDYRSSIEGGNHETIIVNIEELYDQFSMGIPKHPLAVRHFVNFAIDKWNISPEFLFLIGKSVDYSITKSSIAYPFCLIPTFGHQPSDNALTMRNAYEYLPQLALGRLSANTPEDVRLYFDKVLTYENQSECMTIDDVWRKNMIHIAGGHNASQAVELMDYLDVYEEIMENESFGGQVIKKFEQAAFSVQPQPEFPQYMNEGVGIINFFGHSQGHDNWNFDMEAPTTYTNGEKGIYPVIFSNSSFVGDIHEYNETVSSLVEKFVLAENAGAIAMIGNVTFGFPIYSHPYFEEVCRQVAGENYGVGLGKSILQTVHNNFIEDENHVRYEGTKLTNACFHLQGDPAIVLAGSYEKPDFLIDTENVNVLLENEIYNDFPLVFPENEASIDLTYSIFNLGKTIDENLNIYVEMRLTDGTLAYSDEQNIAAPYSETTFNLVLPIDNVADSYEVTIFIDQDNNIEELCEENNTFSFQIISTANTPPEANNINISMLEDSQTSIFVLENAIDAENDVLSIESYTLPNNGTLTQIGNELVYVPDENYFGTDEFTYIVTDGSFISTATIFIAVLAVNDAPVAEDIYKTALEDNERVIAVLFYASDIDSENLSLESYTLPNHGTLMQNDNQLVYLSNDNYFGADEFTYTITDGELSATAIVTMNVFAVNDAPQADNLHIEMSEDSQTSIFTLENTSDAENDTLNLATYTFPSNGTLTQIRDELIYMPNDNFFGTDEFTYTITDGIDSTTVSVSIDVLPINDAPTTPILISQQQHIQIESWENIPLFEWTNSIDVDCKQEPIYELFFIGENGTEISFENISDNSFELNDLSILEPNTTYDYYIIATDCEGATATSDTLSFTTPTFAVAISELSENELFALYQNYPNPFAEKTTFSFFLPKKTKVELTIYNFLGQKVKTVLSETKTKGKHQVAFFSENLSNGIYFYELKTEEMSVSKRMMILR